MSKISKIANKGIQYDLGSSGDNIRVATFNDSYGSVVILEKKAPDLAVMYINAELHDGVGDSRPEMTSVRNDFRGFEGHTYNIFVPYSGGSGIVVDVGVDSNSVTISTSEYSLGSPARISSATAYRVPNR